MAKFSLGWPFCISFFLITLCLSFNHCASAQNDIHGRIVDSLQRPIPQVYVLLKGSKNSPTILEYTTTNEDGRFFLTVADSLEGFAIQLNHLAYGSKIEKYFTSQITSWPLSVKITLQDVLTPLEEVTVTAKKAAITQKNDTTVYNVEQFKDGSERVIEDLIKNLPGMRLAEDGTIFFKGKPVTNLLLDGDDLFDRNYTIGTKNIDVDMVEALEAIENHVSNPLLKDLTTTEDIAINVTLKKGAADISSTNDLAGGIENRADVRTTALGVSKKLKSFAIASYNNVGEENSPYNFFGNETGFQPQSKTPELKRLQGVIGGPTIMGALGQAQRERINDNLFSSVNGIVRINDRLTTKANFDFKKDQLEQFSQSMVFFSSPLDSLNRQQQSHARKAPELYNSKLDIAYQPSKIQLLKIQSQWFDEALQFNEDLVLNSDSQRSSGRHTFDNINQTIEYSLKANENSVFVSDVSAGQSLLDQGLHIAPDYRFMPLYAESNQIVTRKRRYVSGVSSFFVRSNTTFYKLSVGYSYQHGSLDSSLDTFSVPNVFTNSLELLRHYPWLEFDANFKLGNWRIAITQKAAYLEQKLSSQEEIQVNSNLYRVQMLPKAKISYNFNNKTSLDLRLQYDESLIDEEYLYENTIVTSNTSAVENIPDQSPRQTFTSFLDFRHFDSFNLTQFQGGISFRRNFNNYVQFLEIDRSFTFTRREQLDSNFDEVALVVALDTYLPPLKSNLKFNTSYALNTFKNSVNDIELRDNTARTFFSEITLKSGYFGVFNFENSIRFAHSAFSSTNSPTTTNSSFENSLNLIINPFKRLRVIAGCDYHLPSLEGSNSFVFFDLNMTLSSNNKMVEYSLISKNGTPLGNNFTQRNVSEIAISTFSYQLQDPYLMFRINFKL